MSTIFGILNRNTAPVAGKILERIHQQVCHWKPDGGGIWREANAALGHAMLWNTPESRMERLPYVHDLGTRRYVITADARLDNRRPLIENLNLNHLPPSKLTDATLILEAYLKWGEYAPEHLLGDFVFAIWDKSEQKFFCARDHIGIKPFYYHLSAHHFVFSNDMHGIISHPDVPLSYNDRAVSLFLSQKTFRDPDITFIKAIKKLPRATALTITFEKMRARIYWKAEESPDIRFKNSDDYSGMLKELLKQSVYDRTRSDFPIASHLSGGLDSSTIAILAKRCLTLQDKPLQTYSWIHHRKGNENPDNFEWANIRMISTSENIEHRFLELDKNALKASLWNDDLANNELTAMVYERMIVKHAGTKGIRVMLSGWGGDEFISYNARTQYLELLRQGKIPQVMGHIYHQSNSPKIFCAGLYHRLVRPLFLGYPEINMDYSQFAKPAFRQNRHIRKKRRVLLSQLNLLNTGHITSRTESWNTLGFNNKLEYRYPLLDKRIISFALGIPPELYLNKGRARYIFRKAIKGVFPEKIRWGNFKMETHRVKFLMQLRDAAITDWINDLKKSDLSELENRYIDIERLMNYKKIQGITEEITSVCSQNAFIKSIAILRMGHRFTKMRLKSIL